MIESSLSKYSDISRVCLLVICLGCLVPACTSIGPKTIPRDRFDYNNAISDSWKEQTLLNIVKLRYGDVPLFVQVVSIVSGYTLTPSKVLSMSPELTRVQEIP